MKHNSDYWRQEAYWEAERRRAARTQKTREQRRREKADASARMAGVCFLGLLAAMLMKIVRGG